MRDYSRLVLTEREVARFWEKVMPEPNTGCWLWSGGGDVKGYGTLGLFRGKWENWFAHRVSFRLADRHVPDGFQIDHLCHVRCCVNPDHLEPVTSRTNNLRRLHAHLLPDQSRCRFGHEMTEENTYRYPVTKKRRYELTTCRTCRRESRLGWVASNPEYRRASGPRKA